MPETSQENNPKKPSDIIISAYVFNEKNLEHLLGGDKGIKAKVKTDLQKLKIGEMNELAGTILTGLGQEDARWNQDTRDGALEILKALNLKKVSPDIYEIYKRCIKDQGQMDEVDVYGTISSLLEAGKILAPEVPANQYTPDGGIYAIWSDLRTTLQKKLTGLRYHANDDQYIRDEATKILDLLRNNQEKAQVRAKEVEDETFGYRREAPNMDPGSAFLYNEYITVTRQQPSYKLFLWEHTPQFRDLCSQYGVSLERFWNLNNPEEVVRAVTSIKQLSSEAAKLLFSKTLKKTTGLDLTDASDEQLGIFADEVVRAAFIARQELLISTKVQDFDQLKTRFERLISEAQNARPQARSKLIGPILQFLEENGQDTLDLKELDQLASFWLNDQSTVLLRQTLQQKQQDRMEAAANLSSLFNLESQNRHITLASRQESDLYLGDVTGDCTAFHLHTGMNAWTVPVWLSDPGFNFFKILDDQGQLVAKLGLILALNEGKPTMVIDSLETSKRIKKEDEEAAKLQIINGIQALKEWALKIGMSNVYLEKISNSTDVSPILDQISQLEEGVKLEVLGGLSGVSEFRTSIGGSIIEEKIYLQSAHNFELDEAEIDTIERAITKTLSVCSEDQRQKFEDAIKNNQWEEVFATIIDRKYPDVGIILGNNYSTYLSLENSVVYQIEEMIAKEAENFEEHALSKDIYREYKNRHNFPVSDESDKRRIEEAIKNGLKEELPPFDEDEAMQQALELEHLIITLRDMNLRDRSPKQALEILYHNSQAADNGSFSLNSTISKLS